ncbi:MAG: transcriptional regulator [Gammaproteobacteria bacterium HGW-Gammaproteobacteria-13]|nr:MAG: transcriptional regulator [Gammaproteobacteria bacterium HGW-Gammaproteobacteria-13]
MASPLGQKINERRRELGMSLERLAAETESSKSYLWELENRDKPNPSADKVSKIAAVLGVTAQYLMDEEIGSPDQAVKDEAFFRKYRQLKDADKAKLEMLLDVFSKES